MTDLNCLIQWVNANLQQFKNWANDTWTEYICFLQTKILFYIYLVSILILILKNKAISNEVFLQENSWLTKKPV